MTSADELLAAIDSLHEVVERWRPLLRTEPIEDALPKMLAAGALSRSCALLRSAQAIIRADEVEGVGHLARGVWETTLVGTYVLTDGLRGVLRLNADQTRQELALVRANDVDHAVVDMLVERMAMLVERERQRLLVSGETDAARLLTRFDRLKVEELAREVGPLLVENGLEESASADKAYDLLYRAHSTFDAHGLAAVERHIDLDLATGFNLDVDAPGWIEAHRAIGVASLYVGLLARYVFHVFALGDAEDQAGEILDGLRSLLEGTTGDGPPTTR